MNSTPPPSIYNEGEELYLVLPKARFAQELTSVVNQSNIKQSKILTNGSSDGIGTELGNIEAYMSLVEVNRINFMANYLACERLDKDIHDLTDLMRTVVETVFKSNETRKFQMRRASLLGTGNSTEEEIIKRDIRIDILENTILSMKRANSVLEMEIDSINGNFGVDELLTPKVRENIKKIYENIKFTPTIQIEPDDVFSLEGDIDMFSNRTGTYKKVKLPYKLNELIEVKPIDFGGAFTEYGVFARVNIPKNTLLDKYRGKIYFGRAPYTDYNTQIIVVVDTSTEEIVPLFGETSTESFYFDDDDETPEENHTRNRRSNDEGEGTSTTNDDDENSEEDEDYNDDNDNNDEDDDREEDEEEDSDASDVEKTKSTISSMVNSKNYSIKADSDTNTSTPKKPYDKARFVVDSPYLWQGKLNHKWNFINDKLPTVVEDKKYFANMLVTEDGTQITTRDIDAGEELTWNYNGVDFAEEEDNYWSGRPNPIWNINGISQTTCDELGKTFISLFERSDTELTDYRGYLKKRIHFNRLPDIIQKEIEKKHLYDLYILVLSQYIKQNTDVSSFNKTPISGLNVEDLLSDHNRKISSMITSIIEDVKSTFYSDKNEMLEKLVKTREIIRVNIEMMESLKSVNKLDSILKDEDTLLILSTCFYRALEVSEEKKIREADFDWIKNKLIGSWEELYNTINSASIKVPSNMETLHDKVKGYGSKILTREITRDEALIMAQDLKEFYYGFSAHATDLLTKNSNSWRKRTNATYTSLSSFKTLLEAKIRSYRKKKTRSDEVADAISEAHNMPSSSSTSSTTEKRKVRSIKLKNHVKSEEILTESKLIWKLNAEKVVCREEFIVNQLHKGFMAHVFDFNPSELDCMWKLSYSGDPDKDSIHKSSTVQALQILDGYMNYLDQLIDMMKKEKKATEVFIDKKKTGIIDTLKRLRTSMEVMKYYRMYQERLVKVNNNKPDLVHILDYFMCCLSLLDYMCQLFIQSGSLVFSNKIRRGFTRLASPRTTMEGTFHIRSGLAEVASKSLNTAMGMVNTIDWYKGTTGIEAVDDNLNISNITANIAVDQWLFHIKNLLDGSNRALMRIRYESFSLLSQNRIIIEDGKVEFDIKKLISPDGIMMLEKLVELNNRVDNLALAERGLKSQSITDKVNRVIMVIRDAIENKDHEKSQFSKFWSENGSIIQAFNYAMTLFSHNINNIVYRGVNGVTEKEREKLESPTKMFMQRINISFFENKVSESVLSKYKKKKK
jgi:hypothetical protein